ncbi:phosphotransferase [Thermaerobacillus caldiproteolyticus]|uniref:phosphotransferase n=1 Tax=Thermaerobacillus caldiproteolyticus TaxID=247480 RepID=UPI0018F2273F|nr:phosphotransferase [Anoxybacillus caldiproteolyticus]
MTNRNGRDDTIDRLSFLLEAEYGLHLEKLTVLKPRVWLVHTDEGKWILKGYQTFSEAARQLLFLHSLNQAGFSNAPSIRTTTFQNGIFTFQQAYWILQTYIPHVKRLSFTYESDIRDGLTLLMKYHTFTEQLVNIPFFRATLPHYHLYEKWWQRYHYFYSHLPFIERVMDKEELAFILECAQYFLHSFSRFAPSLAEEAVTIIHGDVASHNFLRTEEGTVYLIDYDLIVIAPSSIDYLQYASRILPHLQWSMDRLQEFPPFSLWLTKPWFLYALLFPADIMREWRIILQNNRLWTIPYFHERKQFVQKIVHMIR